MRSKLLRGISAIEVQVSLMETSQNTIFFLPPIQRPTRNYSHTYNQMLQSNVLREREEGPTASLCSSRGHMEPNRISSNSGAVIPVEALWYAGGVPRMPEQELATCLLQQEEGH